MSIQTSSFNRLILVFIFCFSTIALFAQTNWNSVGNEINGEGPGDWSGNSLSVSGDGTTIVIGAPFNDGAFTDAGHVRVYIWLAGAWVQKGADIDGDAAFDLFGFSVDISFDGNTIVVGAPNNDGNGSNSGHVRVYDWNGANWVQKGLDINGEAASDSSGYSVSLSDDGNTVAIGAPKNSGGGLIRGHARIYNWNGSNWIQQGADLDGKGAGHQSGFAVDLSGDASTVAISNVVLAFDSGRGKTVVYNWNGLAWVQKGLDLDGENRGDESGASVSLSEDGNVLAIGSPKNDAIGPEAGMTRVYEWNGTAWSQRGVDLDGEAAGDFAGRSVSLSNDGRTLAVGALNNDDAFNNAGHTRIYDWNGSQWIKIGQDIDGTSVSENSGYSVALNGDGRILAVGAPLNSDAGASSGEVRVFCFGLAVLDGIRLTATTCQTLREYPDSVVIYGLDSSLTRGMEMSAGFIEGLYFTMVLDSVDVGPKTRYKTEYYGEVGGTPDQLAASLTEYHFEEDSIVYEMDFSAMGAPTYTVEIYDGQILKFSSSGNSGLALKQSGNQCTTIYIDGHCYERWSNQNVINGNVSNDFTIAGTLVTGNTVFFKPDAATQDYIPNGKAKLLASDIPRMTMLGQGVFQFGYKLGNRGNSLLFANDDTTKLSVFNIDNSGNDGIQIRFDSVLSKDFIPFAHFSWIDPASYTTINNGANMQMDVHGTISGADVFAGRLQVSRNGGNNELSASLTNLGTDSLDLVILDSLGNIQLERTVARNVFGTVNDWPCAMRWVNDSLDDPYEKGTYAVFCWKHETQVSLSSGGSFPVKNLLIRLDGTPSKLDKLKRAELLISSIDSIVLIDSCKFLDECQIDQRLEVVGDSIKSLEDGGTYQWLYCDNNFSTIPGETSSSLRPNFTGDFACEIRKNGCIDTTACILFNYVGLQTSAVNEFKIYPNPTSGNISIQCSKGCAATRAEVYNTFGMLLSQYSIEGKENLQIQLSDHAGMYIVRIISENGSSSYHPVIRQ